MKAFSELNISRPSAQAICNSRSLSSLTVLLASFVWIAILHDCLASPAQSDNITEASGISTSASDPALGDIAAIEVLAENCTRCHGSVKHEGGLRLDRPDLAKLGGDSGAAIVPGMSEISRLIQRVSEKGDSIMPPKGEPLSAQQIATLVSWVDSGATWPDGALKDWKKETEAERGIPWSFNPVQRPEVPNVNHRDSVANEIDSFVLARQEQVASPVRLRPQATDLSLSRSRISPDRRRWQRPSKGLSVTTQPAILKDRNLSLKRVA